MFGVRFCCRPCSVTYLDWTIALVGDDIRWGKLPGCGKKMLVTIWQKDKLSFQPLLGGKIYLIMWGNAKFSNLTLCKIHILSEVLEKAWRGIKLGTHLCFTQLMLEQPIMLHLLIKFSYCHIYQQWGLVNLPYWLGSPNLEIYLL